MDHSFHTTTFWKAKRVALKSPVFFLSVSAFLLLGFLRLPSVLGENPNKRNPTKEPQIPLVTADDFTNSPADHQALFETLKRLDPERPIWITPDRKRVVLIGTVCLREGLLELFACGKNTKEHESIISLDVKPYMIHAALLVIGAKKGEPARFSPTFVPPRGEEIEVLVRWKNSDGSIEERRAQELIRQTDSKEEMSTAWVFTGGAMGKDPKGRSYYLADVTGEIIGVSNFPGTILDLPIESSADNNLLLFEPYTERIPPLETEVTLILSRVHSAPP